MRNKRKQLWPVIAFLLLLLAVGVLALSLNLINSFEEDFNDKREEDTTDNEDDGYVDPGNGDYIPVQPLCGYLIEKKV